MLYNKYYDEDEPSVVIAHALKRQSKAFAKTFDASWHEKRKLEHGTIAEFRVFTPFCDLAIAVSSRSDYGHYGCVIVTPRNYLKNHPSKGAFEMLFDFKTEKSITKKFFSLDELVAVQYGLYLLSIMGKSIFEQEALRKYGCMQNDEHKKKLLEHYIEMAMWGYVCNDLEEN